MHVPDGFVSPEVAIAAAAVAVVGLGVCAHRAGRQATPRQLPLAGVAAALFLAVQTPVIPIVVGTEGHLLGGTLAVAVLGPWLGPVVIAVVTVVQALFLGDGGLSTLGVNVVNLALVPAVVGYPLILGLRWLLGRRHTSTAAAAGISAVVSVLTAAVLFTGEYAVGGAAGIPLHTVAITTLGVYGVIAVIEGVFTALVIRGLLSLRADLVRVGRGEPAGRSADRSGTGDSSGDDG